MVKFRTTGYILDDNVETPNNSMDLIVDTDDVLIAVGHPEGVGETCLLLKIREMEVVIKMDFNAYSAITLAGVEHLTTYGQIAGK